ncbi:hypothetical protein AGR2A_pc0171 [Agrobacterium genomosp. 2 str. CFBP 5494]|uniref:Uncharacterized protein n=1 Tax=Agrobacterium genomosp. 2 str. CFBP 5494 TaxID=1183436 RepID=A0A9W5F3G1_9HYPH|nr:hypothetical protein AGR2A_pc0171 [Agrobacterium genomosp. 2 str. CFBP 5494]
MKQRDWTMKKWHALARSGGAIS